MIPSEPDTLSGAADVLVGGTFGDRLAGGAGDDTLMGSGTAVCVTLLAGSYAPSVDGFVV